MPSPINYLGMTSVEKNIWTIVDTTDPWIFPSQDDIEVPLLVAKVSYQSIFDATYDSILTPPISKELDEAYFPAWEENSTYSYEFLDMVLPSDEAIMEAMIGPEKICEDLHHKSYFLPKQDWKLRVPCETN